MDPKMEPVHNFTNEVKYGRKSANSEVDKI